MKYLFCDRCGKKQEVDEEGFPLEQFWLAPAAVSSALDLCPACQESYTKLFARWQIELDKWLKEWA